MTSSRIPERDLEYLWGKFPRSRDEGSLRIRGRRKLSRGISFDPSTGLDNETIKRQVMALADEMRDQPHPVVKARAFELVTRRVRIDVSPRDWFVAFGCGDRHDRPLSPLMAKWEKEVDETLLTTRRLLDALNGSGAAVLWKDFDHSVPDWDAVLALGFPGILERARRRRREREARGGMTPEDRAYFDGIEITYQAILEMLARFASLARSNAAGDARMLACADCLDALGRGAPTTLYEALQLIYLYFMFSEHIDRFQARSLGNLDRLLQPFYAADLKEGRCDEARARELIDYFLMQWASIDNYWGQPLYLGGTKADGQSEISQLSHLILEEYDLLDICTPKIQLKISARTPREFVDKALDMIRRGHNSLVFICEESIMRSLMGIGATWEEARSCDISGCYEFSPKGKSNGTTAGHVNMLKPIELVLHNGIDPTTGIDLGCRTGDLANLATFDDFHAAYLSQLGAIIEHVMTCAADVERHLSRINPSNVFSATVTRSLETARDAFQNGSVYNLSAILQAGFATAVDALMAVRKLVYERNELTLARLRDLLRGNWEGSGTLRTRMLHDPDKFGNGIDAVDLYAEAIARFMANKINMRPNGRDGFFVASMHSARTFIQLGEKTGATPDGRLAGEEMSKNISPTMGMDANGVTALLASVARVDSALFPGDFPLDLMLHPTTVEGDEGLAAMRTLLRTYRERHGVAAHFNIFDADTLVDAQRHPDKYQGLQVRVCGWNATFTELSRQEQDMYIRRARNIRR